MQHVPGSMSSSSSSSSLPRRCSFSLLLPTKRLDRGWSWTVCVAAFFILAFFNAARGSAGVFYIGLLERFTDSTHQIAAVNSTEANTSASTCNTEGSGGISGTTATIGSVQTAMLCIFGLPAAHLSSRFSPRGVLVVGAVVYSAGAYATTYAKQVWQAVLCYAVLAGIGTGLIYTPTVGLLPLYFSKYLPVASALSITGLQVGSAAFNPIARWLLRDYGLDNVILAYTVLGLAIGLFAILIRRPPEVAPPQTAAAGTTRAVTKYKTILKHRRFMLWCAAMSLHFFTYYLPTYHLIRYAECSLKIGSSHSSLLLTFHYVAAAVGGIGIGVLATRIRNHIALQAFTLFLGALPNFLFPLYETYTHVVVYALLTGALMGKIVLNVIVCRDLLGSIAAMKGYGVYSFISVFPATLGPIVTGWLYDVFQSYAIPFVIAGGIDLLATILMLICATGSQCLVSENQEDPSSTTTTKRSDVTPSESATALLWPPALWIESTV